MTALPDTYTTAEVAASLKKSTDWLYDQVEAGLANPARAGDAKNSRMIWTRADVDKLLAALRPTPLPKPTRRRRRAA